MSETSGKKRPVILLTLAEILCAAAVIGTLFLLCMIGEVPLWQHIGAVAVAFCALSAEYGAMLICHRARKSSVFTQETVKILGRIAGVLAVMAALLLPLGLPVMNWLMQGLPEIHVAVRAALPTFTALGLAAMARTVQLLMRRAVSLQSDNDLTV